MTVPKNYVPSWSSDLCTGLEMSASSQYSLVFGQIVLLGLVKKWGEGGKNVYSGICQLMKELWKALDYAHSHLFLNSYLFCLQCYQRFQNAAIQSIFSQETSWPCGLFPLSQPPLPSPFHLPFVFITILSTTIFKNLKYQATLCAALFFFLCQRVPSRMMLNCSLWTWRCFEILLVVVFSLSDGGF